MTFISMRNTAEDSDDEAEPTERMGGIEPAQSIAPRVNVAYPNGYEPTKRRFSVSSESFHPEVLTQPSVIRAMPKTDEVRFSFTPTPTRAAPPRSQKILTTLLCFSYSNCKFLPRL